MRSEKLGVKLCPKARDLAWWGARAEARLYGGVGAVGGFQHCGGPLSPSLNPREWVICSPPAAAGLGTGLLPRWSLNPRLEHSPWAGRAGGRAPFWMFGFLPTLLGRCLVSPCSASAASFCSCRAPRSLGGTGQTPPARWPRTGGSGPWGQGWGGLSTPSE